MAKKKDNTDPQSEMRKRFENATTACNAKYALCVDDVRFGFIPGEQWDKSMLAARKDRMNYEFNKTRPVVKMVTNAMRQNQMGIVVKASEDSHRDLAVIMNGLIRNIEAQSRATTAYDTAGFFAAAGGFGVIEIATEYANDDVFDQDIRIKEKRNPFAIKFDPNAKEFDKRDGRYAFEELTFSTEAFKERWPDADETSFGGNDAPSRYGQGWFNEKQIRVVKYWCKHKSKKTIYQLSDGRVLDEDDYQAIAPTLVPQEMIALSQEPMLALKRTRDVDYDRITCSYESGKETLEGPYEWAGKFIPLIPVWGESVNIEGEEFYSGLVRPLRDSQKVFNWSTCVGFEAMANQPRAPIMASNKMVEGYEEAWQNMAVSNPPALFYNVDPDNPSAKPERLMPPNFPAGFFQSAQFGSDLIKSVSNVVDAPVQSRASSGKAIQAVANQQDVGNFDFPDNLGRALAFVGEQLVDLIPKIYDTERQVMILGEDGKEKYETLNKTAIGPDGTPQIINDLSQGKYSVTVTVGPSWATQRQETFETLTNLAQSAPNLAPVMADLIAKNLDFKGSEELEKRLRKQGVAQGFIEPAEGEPPAGPPPQVQQMIAQIQEKGAQIQEEQQRLEKTKAEVEKLIAQLGTKEAQLEAKEAKAVVAIQRMLPQEREAPEPSDNGVGKAAVELATVQAIPAASAALAPLVEQITQLVPMMAETAQMNAQAAALNAQPKTKQGTMVRMDDGSYQIQVVES